VALICRNCRQIHPDGAVTCEQAREAIAQRGQKIDHKIEHHKETHRGCKDPYNCVIREDQLAKDQARSKMIHVRF